MSLGSCFPFVSSGARWCRAGRSSVASPFSWLKTKLKAGMCGVRNRSSSRGNPGTSSESCVNWVPGSRVLPKTQEPKRLVSKRDKNNARFKEFFGIDRSTDQPASGVRKEVTPASSDLREQGGQGASSTSRLARKRWQRDMMEVGEKWKTNFQADAGPGYADAPPFPVLSPERQTAQMRETAGRIDASLRSGGRVEVTDSQPL